tara:strand:+ start:466 stop:648 length:183 start_codon:yes stop_codon:yes gene_type:complete
MKLNIAVGRKADKFKVLYVGNSADKALEAMTEAANADKPKFEEVTVYKSPLHYRRRKISA